MQDESACVAVSVRSHTSPLMLVVLVLCSFGGHAPNIFQIVMRKKSLCWDCTLVPKTVGYLPDVTGDPDSMSSRPRDPDVR